MPRATPPVKFAGLCFGRSAIDQVSCFLAGMSGGSGGGQLVLVDLIGVILFIVLARLKSDLTLQSRFLQQGSLQSSRTISHNVAVGCLCGS